MGVTIKTIEEYTCDVCHKPCEKDDAEIHIITGRGDGRDVGSSAIKGRLTFYAPYQCTNGVVCKECKTKWLKHYVSTL